MTDNPLHAKYFADHAVVEQGAEVLENAAIARDTWRTRIACPQLAARIRPGQFVMVRLSGCNDPLIGRPLAMYDVEDDNSTLDVVWVVKGKLTTRLARLQAGQRLDVWGPLGNGFAPRNDRHLILVAGGIGQTPFLALAKQRLGRRSYAGVAAGGSAERVTLCYGARTADLLAGVEDFQAAGMDVRLCTDDGTRGRHGLVTAELDELLAAEADQRPHVICCGPEPMMEAAAEVARRHQVGCEVSLETPMACGIGICFTCVARIKQPDGTTDYKRTCVDGPVFDAAEVVW